MKNKLNGRTEEVTLLASLGHSYASASILLDVNRSTIRKFALKHGIAFHGKREKHFNNPESIANIVSMYKEGFTGYAIADKLKINNKTVYDILNQNNIELESNNYASRGHTRLDYNAFLDFENDMKAAYFYGWLLTDGNISDNGSITISLQIKDSDVLENLYKYIGLDKPPVNSVSKLKDKTFPIARFSLNDKILSTRLVNQGLVPRKSMKETVPLFYDKHKESARYFWRGCIEGDGCVCVSGKAASVSFVGSKELILSFIEYAEDVCEVPSKGKSPYFVKKTSNLYMVAYSNDSAMKICKYLWNGEGPSLSRKENNAKILIEKESRRQLKYVTKYIYKSKDKFELRVRYKQQPIHVAMFDSISEAKEHRDDFIDLLNSYIQE